jgi:hypothetical protein
MEATLDVFPLRYGRIPARERAAYWRAGQILKERMVDSSFVPCLDPEPYPHVGAMRQDLLDTGRIRVSCVNLGHGFAGDDGSHVRFRAWHDLLHIAANRPFTQIGEHGVAEYADRLLREWDVDADVRVILAGEVIAQTDYFEIYKRFPTDHLGRQPYVKITAAGLAYVDRWPA